MGDLVRWLLGAEAEGNGESRRAIIMTRNGASDGFSPPKVQRFMCSVSQPSLRVKRRKRLNERRLRAGGSESNPWREISERTPPTGQTATLSYGHGGLPFDLGTKSVG
jgi:hypothetical protein